MLRHGPLVLLAALLVAACSKHVSEPDESTFHPAPPAPVDPGPATLQMTDDVVGKGKEAKVGDNVRVHYTGTLMNGTKFDSSRDRGTPFDFKLGTGAVIKGWDQGVAGMKVGGKRRLVIPQDLGYGAEGSPPNIPAKSGLKFDVELLDVNPPSTGAPPPSEPPPDMGGDFGQEGPPEEEGP
jgi:FKBP-type peptidyl-prolyl cis-trans isomerase FkpA